MKKIKIRNKENFRVALLCLAVGCLFFLSYADHHAIWKIVFMVLLALTGTVNFFCSFREERK